MKPSSLRTILFVLALTWCAPLPAAGPPERISFQGVLRDASGAPAEGSFDMRFRFFGNGPGACDCGAAHGPTGCTDAVCEAEVCAIDAYCCQVQWDAVCAFEAERFFPCQACMANEEVLTDIRQALRAVVVTGGLFNVALGAGQLVDGPSPGSYGSLGEVFRDFDVVYLETDVNNETLSPRIRAEASAYAQNALRLEGKRATEFVDTTAPTQAMAGDLQVGGDLDVGTDVGVAGSVTVGGDLAFADGTSQTTAWRPADPPCLTAQGRFKSCLNGTITDTITGLIWLKDANCPELGGPRNWLTANQAAWSLADGMCGLSDGSSPGDWRLPTSDEWAVVTAQASTNGCTSPGPFIPDEWGGGCWSEGDPFHDVLSARYWSSTSSPASPSAYYVNLANGSTSTDSRIISYYVWPVRARP